MLSYESSDFYWVNPSSLPVVGHSSGGLLAKAFAAKKGLSSVSFDSPVFEHSPSYDVLMKSVLFEEDRGLGWDKMINIYSKDSLFTGSEGNATVNLQYPSPGFMWSLSSPHQTFCQLVAGCAEDDRYDHFCSFAVGPETFMSYFDNWGRSRTPIDPIYLSNLPEQN